MKIEDRSGPGPGSVQEKPRVFEGSVPDYIQRISFGGRLYFAKVNDSVVKVIANGIFILDGLSTFSNSVGLELYSRNCMPVAAECFELAFRQQQIDDRGNPLIKGYARNFINALASHIFSLVNVPPDEVIQNIRWFNTKSEVLEQAEKTIDLDSDPETSKTIREMYRHLYHHVKPA